MTGSVEYEPVSVKAVLAEMKDTAELMIDLSYSAVLFGSPAVAEEVLALEDRMDVLQMRARMSLLVAARSPEDAEALAPVLAVVGATEKISDAAGDIAKVVLEEIGLPDALRSVLPEAVETVARTDLVAGSEYVDRSLADVNLETETGVRIIAIRRGGGRAHENDGASTTAEGEVASTTREAARHRGARGEWLLNPDRDTVLQAGDVLVLRGQDDQVAAVSETASGEAYEPPGDVEAGIADLERAVDAIVLMKNVSEVAVDLAYGAVLYDSTALAEEVAELEAEVDALESRFEAWTLRAAARVDDPVSLRGLVHLAGSTEVISDAALEIAEGVLRGLGTHPVVAEAVFESDEVVVRLEVAPGSALAGASLGEREVATETGMRVIAVRHQDADGDEWEPSPGPKTVLHAGDVVVAKGTRAGADRLASLAGDESLDVDD
ncbi:TrkA C-terminal domain-containing protein [Halorubellus sp. PRR65]|uniref:potassium channel family protein n=1 Tax=Halorubellus sp. PRR65 TaxID=3098148 RepID=UPI002B25CC96|nr:TrkA C-terminal domain-containing protein [Halorubellus sp. PRR65]